LDDRRLDAIRREEERAKKTARDQTAQISPEQKFQELTEEAITNATLNLYMTLVSVYHTNMGAVSKLLGECTFIYIWKPARRLCEDEL
jgi:hypothetical protein